MRKFHKIRRKILKKIILYFLIIILICFFVPAIFTTKFKLQEATNNNDIISVQKYDYGNYNMIKLLHSETGEIEEVALDDYLVNVVSAEMPASYEKEALKAQAIVARTYTIYQTINSGNKHEGANMCDSHLCCQAWISKEDRFAKWEPENSKEYWQKIETAVNETKGKIVTYKNEPINAFFHASSGGKTEIPLNVWGGNGYPYLQVVETSGEEGYTQFASEIILTKEEFINKIKEKHSDFQIDFSKENEISILELTESGRVKTIKIGNLNLSGVEVRSILGLKSANFTFTIDESNIKFSIIGYGHGVGMSQTGADSLAKQGKTCEEIIKHYYVGVEIVDM